MTVFYESSATSAMGTEILRGNGDGVDWVRAGITIGTGNSQLRFEAERPGTYGNTITVTLVAAGNNTPLTVSVTDKDITVNLATNGSAASISTVREVIRALEASDDASRLVYVDEGSGLGTGVVAAATETSLTGGVDSTETFTDIAEITNFDGPSEEADEAEVTHFKSPKFRKEFIATLIDSGSLQLDLNYLPNNTSQENLRQDLNRRRYRNYRIRYNDDDRATFEFRGRVMSIGRSGQLADPLKGSCRIRVNGEFYQVA